jgi:hypothetical protein
MTGRYASLVGVDRLHCPLPKGQKIGALRFDHKSNNDDYRRERDMHRTAINPVSWSLNLGFDQGELVEGHQRLLVCSGQDAVDAEGPSIRAT